MQSGLKNAQEYLNNLPTPLEHVFPKNTKEGCTQKTLILLLGRGQKQTASQTEHTRAKRGVKMRNLVPTPRAKRMAHGGSGRKE